MTSKLDTAGLVEIERWTIDDGADVEALKRLLRPATLERFLSYIESGTPDECWGWTGSVIKKDGRGTFSLGRSAHTAPRIILALHSRRWVASDVMACHECDNPNCVNPKHLWWGSNAENLLDASIKGPLPSASLWRAAMKLDQKALERAIAAFRRKAPKYWLDVRDADMHVAKANESAITAYLTAIGETHVLVPRGEGWQDIATAPKGQQIIGWEPNYGWLLVCHEYGEWRVKGSGNFWNSLPDTVTLTKWHPLPLAAVKEGE